MNTLTLFKKLFTAISLVSQGKLIKSVINEETEWHRERRKNKWQKRLIAGKPIIDRLPNGEFIELYPGDKLSDLIYKRQFEVIEQEFVRRFLRANDTFADVGANLGLYTVIAAKMIGKGGKVYSFEPAASNYCRLLRNVFLNHFTNVHCIKAALSDKEETRTLIVSLDEYGAWNSFATPSVGNQFDTEMVHCITWDKYADEYKLLGKVTLMKIDVEGWELFVVNGATNALSKPDSPELLVEFVDENARNAGSSCNMLYRKLEDLGYKMYEINLDRHILIRHQLQENYPYMNLLATKHIEFVLGRLQFNLG